MKLGNAFLGATLVAGLCVPLPAGGQEERPVSQVETLGEIRRGVEEIRKRVATEREAREAAEARAREEITKALPFGRNPFTDLFHAPADLRQALEGLRAELSPSAKTE